MSQHKLRRTRRAPVAPLVLTGVLALSGAVAVAPYAEGAVDGSSSGSTTSGADLVPVAAVDDATAGYAFDPRTPQRVVPGFRLKAKPPPWQLPVIGYHLPARFGMSSGLWSHNHTGLDFAAPDGTEIRAIGPGVVTEVGYDGAYGNKTVVTLDDGTVLWFCHQSDTAVSVGQRLVPGELLGYVGSTGNVTGPHLHLEVRPGDGDPIDPEDWLPTHGLHP